MEKFEFICGESLNKALKSKHRLYLCGNLQKPQEELECIIDKNIEIGTSDYKEFTADAPHFHDTATEYNYVIKGKVKILLIDEKKEYEFGEDSLFIFQPNTKYACKNQAGTKVYFVKSPGGNDKKIISVNDSLKEWLVSWESKYEE